MREIVLPQLAMGMSEGTIVEWCVAEGERIERDAPLVSIETEKVVVEIPAPYEGFVHIVGAVDKTIPVETMIAQIASTEDEYKQLIASDSGETAVTPAGEELITKGEASQPDAPPGVASGPAMGRVKVSGLAKRIAGLEGIELASITGTGPGGRIVRRDVENAIEVQKSSPVPVPASIVSGSSSTRQEKGRIPLTGMRGAIAERMMQAKLNAAQTYVFFEIDVSKLLLARETMLSRKDELGIRVSMTALYAKALAMACQHVPICNATLEGDEITVWENVDISVAVAMPGKGDYDSGLLVPVLRNAETKNVLQISRELKNLVSQARAGTLGTTEMSNHTVTLSSTAGLSTPGSWLVSAPILNMPAVMAFQPGTPKRTPVVSDDDQIIVRDILPCGLTFDHRAVDGGPIGDFTRKITDLLSNPELMLL